MLFRLRWLPCPLLTTTGRADDEVPPPNSVRHWHRLRPMLGLRPSARPRLVLLLCMPQRADSGGKNAGAQCLALATLLCLGRSGQFLVPHHLAWLTPNLGEPLLLQFAGESHVRWQARWRQRPTLRLW